VVATMLHDAWGNIRTTSGSAHGNYRFAGAERDTTTGLYHMGARFYDPVIARWLSEDPVQDKHFEPATLNFYAYANNNPEVLIDPDGRAVTLPNFGQQIVQLVMVGVVIVATVILASNLATRTVLQRSSESAGPKVQDLNERIKRASGRLAAQDTIGRARAGDPRAINDLQNMLQNLQNILNEITKGHNDPNLTKDQKDWLDLMKEAVRVLIETVKAALTAAGVPVPP